MSDRLQRVVKTVEEDVLSKDEVIYFRADANASVGYGHLMRCLTIADACTKKGLHPVFLMADDASATVVYDRGYSVVVLGTSYDRMEEELVQIRKKIRNHAMIVLDSYHLTQAYVETLRQDGHILLWLDDLREVHYPVDGIVNYNLYAETLGYPADDQRHYLLGAKYAPVREAFTTGSYHVSEHLSRILITTGASDPYGAGILFARGLLERGIQAQIMVVCGAFYPHMEELRKLERAYASQERIRILQNLTDLSGVMRESDFAIAAAGSTVYELCAVGVPSVVYYFADNQRMAAEAFAKQAGSVNLGDLRLDTDLMIERAYQAVRDMQGLREREGLSRRMHELVDGNGAMRIADLVHELAIGARNGD